MIGANRYWKAAQALRLPATRANAKRQERATMILLLLASSDGPMQERAAKTLLETRCIHMRAPVSISRQAGA
jgi:hypothetical protein